MTEFPFTAPDSDVETQIFGKEFEKDENLFFHGTARSNLESILKHGFQVKGTLTSLSFANASGLGLKYACNSRNKESPEGVILVVKYEDLTSDSIRHEHFGIHVDDINNQPEIIGYCIIPRHYKYI